MAAAFLTDRNSNKRQVTGNETCNSSRLKNRNCKQIGNRSIRKKVNGNSKKIKKNNKKKRKKHATAAKKLFKQQFYSSMDNGRSIETTTSLLKENSSLTPNAGINLKKTPLVIIERNV